jgi:hypothetical protein
MLFIRDEYMTSLSRSAFRYRLQAWMRQFRKELCAATQLYSDGELEALLESGASAARDYGLTTEFLVRRYLRVILVAGADEDGRPRGAALRAAMEESGSEIEKLDRLAILVPDPDAAAQDCVGRSQAQSQWTRAKFRASEQPERRVEPCFLMVGGGRAAPEPAEPESVPECCPQKLVF